MICLDSTLMVDFLRNKEGALDVINNLKDEDVVTTIINVFELESGIWALKNTNYQIQLENLNRLLSRIGILELNPDSVSQSARIFGELSKSGKKIDDLDILIAGICLSNKCDRIITDNVKHFSRIKGLNIETY